MDERGVFVCARGENRRSGCVASGSERGVIGSGKRGAIRESSQERTRKKRTHTHDCDRSTVGKGARSPVIFS